MAILVNAVTQTWSNQSIQVGHHRMQTFRSPFLTMSYSICTISWHSAGLHSWGTRRRTPRCQTIVYWIIHRQSSASRRVLFALPSAYPRSPRRITLTFASRDFFLVTSETIMEERLGRKRRCYTLRLHIQSF